MGVRDSIAVIRVIASCLRYEIQSTWALLCVCACVWRLSWSSCKCIYSVAACGVSKVTAYSQSVRLTAPVLSCGWPACACNAARNLVSRMFKSRLKHTVQSMHIESEQSDTHKRYYSLIPRPLPSFYCLQYMASLSYCKRRAEIWEEASGRL